MADVQDEGSGKFRCLYCATEITVTPEMGEETECPQCHRKVAVPGRKQIDLSEFDELLKIIKTDKIGKESGGTSVEKVGQWILMLNLVCFITFWLATSIQVSPVKEMIWLAFLGASIGIFILAVTAMFRSRS